MTNRSKSTLFLIEQLFVVAVFSICAMACVRLLTTAYFYARDTRDISHAIVVAESAAESFKVLAGDIERTANVIGGNVADVEGARSVVVFFDSDWHIIEKQAGNYSALLEGEGSSPYFVLNLVSNAQSYTNPRIVSSSLSVSRLNGNEDVLVDFEVVARKE